MERINQPEDAGSTEVLRYFLHTLAPSERAILAHNLDETEWTLWQLLHDNSPEEVSELSTVSISSIQEAQAAISDKLINELMQHGELYGRFSRMREIHSRYAHAPGWQESRRRSAHKTEHFMEVVTPSELGPSAWLEHIIQQAEPLPEQQYREGEHAPTDAATMHHVLHQLPQITRLRELYRMSLEESNDAVMITAMHVVGRFTAADIAYHFGYEDDSVISQTIEQTLQSMGERMTTGEYARLAMPEPSPLPLRSPSRGTVHKRLKTFPPNEQLEIVEHLADQAKMPRRETDAAILYIVYGATYRHAAERLGYPNEDHMTYVISDVFMAMCNVMTTADIERLRQGPTQ